MNDENIIKASSMIDFAYANIEQKEFEQSNKLFKFWRITLESIKSNSKNGQNLGMNLYTHSRIIDLKNGTLLIEADHPAWIQTLRIYQKYIITGLKRNIPETKIENMVFRLRGTNVALHSVDNEKMDRIERQKLEKKIAEEEKVINKFENSSSDSDKFDTPKKLPEELQKIFDRLKNDMLTEGK